MCFQASLKQSNLAYGVLGVKLFKSVTASQTAYNTDPTSERLIQCYIKYNKLKSQTHTCNHIWFFAPDDAG